MIKRLLGRNHAAWRQEALENIAIAKMLAQQVIEVLALKPSLSLHDRFLLAMARIILREDF